MGLFKEKKAYVATTIVYDEETKRITTTGVVSVHKNHSWACAALHALGYTYGYMLDLAYDQGRTRANIYVLYNPKTLAMAEVREMTLEK